MLRVPHVKKLKKGKVDQLDNLQENLQQAIGEEIPIVHDTRLTSSEIASLWTTYMNYSLINCVYNHFLSNVESEDIRSLIEFASDINYKRTSWVKDLLEKENLPVPIGFTDADVNIHAPRLYSDSFYLYYILNKTRINLPINGLSLTTSARSDVRDFYAHCCDSTATLTQKVSDLLLAKGLYVRSPYITLQKNVNTVKEPSFLAGFLGERRPLLASEVSGLNYAIRMNNLGKSLLIGFRQVSGSKQLREYLNRGVDINTELIARFRSFLEQENIPSPMSPETFVTDSTISPFSDKLIINQILLVASSELSTKTTIYTTSLRRDIHAAMVLSMTELATYIEDGMNLAINNGWFEEPPQLVNRKELANQIH